MRADIHDGPEHMLQSEAGDITCRHNHPSGDPTLSQAEIRMTKAIIDIASPCTITSSSARKGMPA
jgi:DNA repair protein RadC